MNFAPFSITILVKMSKKKKGKDTSTGSVIICGNK
jgi:hypothetical protein